MKHKKDQKHTRVYVYLSGFVSRACSVFVSPPGSSGFISEHHSQSEYEQRLSVEFLQQQLQPEGQDRERTHLHHHRSLPGTGFINSLKLAYVTYYKPVYNFVFICQNLCFP